MLLHRCSEGQVFSKTRHVLLAGLTCFVPVEHDLHCSLYRGNQNTIFTLLLQLEARARQLVKCMLISAVERDVQLCIRNSSFSGHKIPTPGISAQ